VRGKVMKTAAATPEDGWATAVVAASSRRPLLEVVSGEVAVNGLSEGGRRLRRNRIWAEGN
ncbi:hypothetical protein Dimus_029377, partial [Dionaea muscipula]